MRKWLPHEHRQGRSSGPTFSLPSNSHFFPSLEFQKHNCVQVLCTELDTAKNELEKYRHEVEFYKQEVRTLQVRIFLASA